MMEPAFEGALARRWARPAVHRYTVGCSITGSASMGLGGVPIEWKSCARAGKRTWDDNDCYSMAKLLWEYLPAHSKMIINAGRFKCALFKMRRYQNVNMDDLECNVIWLLPIVR